MGQFEIYAVKGHGFSRTEVEGHGFSRAERDGDGTGL